MGRGRVKGMTRRHGEGVGRLVAHEGEACARVTD